MRTEYLELEDNRVLRVEMDPGPEVAGLCERQVRVSVEAGAPFSAAEWQLISSTLAGLAAIAPEAVTGWGESSDGVDDS